jgi:hypothetical protein
VVRFLWVKAEDSSSEKVAGKSRSLKSKDMVLWPPYDREFVSLEKVSKHIWERYQKVLALRGGKKRGK